MAKKLDEVAAAIERMEGMAMQSASNGAKAQSEVSPPTPAASLQRCSPPAPRAGRPRTRWIGWKACR